jgi:hypothetical protein
MDIDDIFQMIASIPDLLIDGTWTMDQLADLLVDNDIDITALSNDELDELLSKCMNPNQDDDISNIDPIHQSEHAQVSFTGHAGACWWCHGTGVVWSGGKNVPCPKCGGSGIGPV